MCRRFCSLYNSRETARAAGAPGSNTCNGAIVALSVDVSPKADCERRLGAPLHAHGDGRVVRVNRDERKQPIAGNIEEERSMTGKFTPADGIQADPFAQEAADKVREVRDATFDAARAATKKVDEARPAVAERLDTAASIIEERAEGLPGGQKVKEFAQAAADSLSGTADYMRSHDARRMMADVQILVRNNPGPALLIAAVFGFMLGRTVVRN